MRTKKAKIDYAAIIAEKTAAKEQIETEIVALSDNISALKDQLKSKNLRWRLQQRIFLKQRQKGCSRKKAAEESKKAEAESVLKKLLASGMSADEIIAKLQ